MSSSGYRALQTILGISAFPLAIWPLVQYFLGNQQNRIFRSIFGDPEGSLRWIIPVIVLVVIALICWALDALDRRTQE